MCGRYTITVPDNEIQERFDAQIREMFYHPRYNAAPSQALPVILNTDSAHIVPAEWGFLPSWAKNKDFKPLINARAETAAQKPMFRHALKGNRCLVLADGFYEWKKTEAGKVPYRITLANQEPFAFAGIWNVLEKEDNALLTFAILTTAPNELMQDIHNRMPVILPAAAEAAWLDPTKDAGDVKDLLKPYSAAEMTAYPVSKKVNIPSIDVPELIIPLSPVSSIGTTMCCGAYSFQCYSQAAYASRVFTLRMVAVKNSTKRQAVFSPVRSIRTGRPPGRVMTAGHGCRCRWPFKV